jgi:hypothetical protein
LLELEGWVVDTLPVGTPCEGFPGLRITGVPDERKIAENTVAASSKWIIPDECPPSVEKTTSLWY